MSSNYRYNDLQQIQILPLLKENKQISQKKQKKQMSKVGQPYIIYLQYSIKCKYIELVPWSEKGHKRRTRQEEPASDHSHHF